MIDRRIMEKSVCEKWLARVRYDMDTAQAMYTTGRYIYTVFMCQQAIEKCLKALMAHNGGEIVPIHNLRRLAKMAGVLAEVGSVDLEKMDFLSQFYLNARYKEDIEELSLQANEGMARDFLDFSREKVQWLTRKIRPWNSQGPS